MKTRKGTQEWMLEDLWGFLVETNAPQLEEVQRALGVNLTPSWPTIGLIHSDPAEPGRYRWIGYDDNRRQLEASDVKYVDSQADLPSAGEESDASSGPLLAGSPTSGEDAETDGIGSCEDRVRDPRTPLAERAAVLQEWIVRDQDGAAPFVVEELHRADLDPAWRDVLIYAAEDVRFLTEQHQERVWKRLYELALELRNDTTSGVEQVAWSAVRRLASLLPEHEAGRLRQFLDHRSIVDMRLATLQAIICIFENAPPANWEAVQSLADRVYQLGMKIIDPDIMTAGETSAIAEAATHALAVLGDSRVTTCIDRLQQLGWEWLLNQVRCDLRDVRDAWGERGLEVCRHPAYKKIDSILNDVGE